MILPKTPHSHTRKTLKNPTLTTLKKIPTQKTNINKIYIENSYTNLQISLRKTLSPCYLEKIKYKAADQARQKETSCNTHPVSWADHIGRQGSGSGFATPSQGGCRASGINQHKTCQYSVVGHGLFVAANSRSEAASGCAAAVRADICGVPARPYTRASRPLRSRTQPRSTRQLLQVRA